jgi:hypothetical protein
MARSLVQKTGKQNGGLLDRLWRLANVSTGPSIQQPDPRIAGIRVPCPSNCTGTFLQFYYQGSSTYSDVILTSRVRGDALSPKASSLEIALVSGDRANQRMGFLLFHRKNHPA